MVYFIPKCQSKLKIQEKNFNECGILEMKFRQCIKSLTCLAKLLDIYPPRQQSMSKIFGANN